MKYLITSILVIFTITLFAIPGAFAVFPDPEKDPRHYLVRYYTEPDYQAWFDKNYPNDTIEDKVGYSKKIVTDDYYVSPFGFAVEPPKDWDIEVSPSAMADDEGNVEAGLVGFTHFRASDCNSYSSQVIVWYDDVKKQSDWQGQGITSWSDLDLLWYFGETMIFDEQSNLKITDQSVTKVSNDEYIVRYDFTDSNILPPDEECPNKLNVTLKNSMIYFLEPGGEYFEFIFAAEPQDYDTDISEINKMLKTFHTGKTQKLSDLLADYAPKVKSAAAESNVGCGPGTIMVNGVCELKQEVKSEPIQTSENCGPGTTMVNGVCELKEASKSTSMFIEPLYIIIAVVAIGGAIGAIAVAKRGSKSVEPKEQPKEEPKEQLSRFCENCGNQLKPTAKFCGKCGTQHS